MKYLIIGDTYLSLLEAQKILTHDNVDVNILIEGTQNIDTNLLLQHFKSMRIRIFDNGKEKLYEYYISQGLNSDIICNENSDNTKIQNTLPKCNIYYNCKNITAGTVGNVSFSHGYREDREDREERIEFDKIIWTCHPYNYLKFNPKKYLYIPALYRAVIPILNTIDISLLSKNIIKRNNFVIKIFTFTAGSKITSDGKSETTGDENSYASRCLPMENIIKADDGKKLLIIEAINLDNLRKTIYENDEIKIYYNDNEQKYLDKFHKIVQYFYNKITTNNMISIPKETNICDQGTCINHFNITNYYHRQSSLELELLYTSRE
jgi:hypothetical protein